MMMMMNMMTRKSRVSGFSRGKLEAVRNELYRLMYSYIDMSLKVVVSVF